MTNFPNTSHIAVCVTYLTQLPALGVDTSGMTATRSTPVNDHSWLTHEMVMDAIRADDSGDTLRGFAKEARTVGAQSLAAQLDRFADERAEWIASAWDDRAFVPTHVLTLALPGFPHPDARTDVPAMRLRRNVYRTQAGTVYTPNATISIRQLG